jgi:sugar-specific transcriptional regulator TrmB
MTDIQVEAIVEELSREQARLRERLTALKSELAEIEAALARVNGALDALRGKEKAKRMRRPAASKQDVIELVEAVLGERQPLGRTALRHEVEQRVLASGKSRMGLALRFKEALGEPQFVTTPEGIQLDDGLPPERLSA